MIERLGEQLTRIVERLVAYALILAVALNFANVVARYVFRQPILGADEVQLSLMVWMTFLGVVVVTWRNLHLRMDLLATRLPALARALLRTLELVVLATLAALIVGESSRYAARMFEIGRRSDALDLPIWIPHSAVVIGFGLMGLIALYRLYRMASREPPP